MTGLIGIAVFALGLLAWIYLQRLADTSNYSGDGGIALVIPVIGSWILMAVGVLLALIGLGIWIYQHVQFH